MTFSFLGMWAAGAVPFLLPLTVDTSMTTGPDQHAQAEQPHGEEIPPFPSRHDRYRSQLHDKETDDAGRSQPSTAGESPKGRVGRPHRYYHHMIDNEMTHLIRLAWL